MRVLCVVALLCLALAQVELASVKKGSRPDGRLDRHFDRQQRQGVKLRIEKPPPPNHNTLGVTANVKTNWLDTQRLDHFDPTNDKTWRQRYFSNSELYAEGGPVFIMVEGESAASTGWIDRGGSYMYSMAELFKANMYVVEHRFFGLSQPTVDISTANLKWLTSDQALADLAFLIEDLIEKGEIKKDQKVAVFGGSYPGNLVAWARLKYPHLIHAAVASSAPVHAEVDFIGYMEVVSRSIRKIAGNECADNVEKGFNRIQKLLMTTDGISQIENLFYMCDRLNTTNKLDTALFYSAVSGAFAGAAQYNRDNNPAYSLKSQCSYMEGKLSDDEAVSALADVVVNNQDFFFGCIDFEFTYNMQDLTSTRYSYGDRQWIYMTCAAFGYFQTTNGDTVFPKDAIGLDYFLEQCKLAFGDKYDEELAQRAVKNTNLVFGDWTPDVKNVMFVNGEIDPWHALSVLEDVNESSPAVLISSTSHCYDMYATAKGDSEELLQAREKVKEFLLNALYTNGNSANPTLSP